MKNPTILERMDALKEGRTFLQRMRDLEQSPELDRLTRMRRREIASEIPVSFCCPAAAGSGVLLVEPKAWDRDPGAYEVPTWFARARHGSRPPVLSEVRFCPHCGTSLPSFVARTDPPSPLCTPDGGRCGTCRERYDSCLCYPPQCAWSVEGAPPVFAAVCYLTRPSGRGPEILSVSRKGRPDEKGLPGGRCEPGEDPEETARRELLEETGYVAGPMHKVFDAMDDAKVRVVCYAVEDFDPGEPGAAEETGLVEWLPPEAFLKSSPFASFNAGLFSRLGVK